MMSGDPIAAVQQTIREAFEFASSQPETALPHIDQMERLWRDAAVEAGAPEGGMFPSVIHSLRFVAYSRIATIEFQRTRQPGHIIATNCELALHCYRLARDAGADTETWEIDGVINLLELCRPGGAYDMLGTIKIKHLAACERILFPPVFLQAVEAGAIGRPELDCIANIELTAKKGTIRYATIGYLGPSKWLIALYDNAAPLGSNQPGVIQVGQLEKTSGKWRFSDIAVPPPEKPREKSGTWLTLLYSRFVGTLRQLSGRRKHGA